VYGTPITLMVAFMLITTLFAGCSGLGNINPNAKLISDVGEINAGETVNFDARGSTTPDPTIIEEYRWDFDDGNQRTTKQGVANHQFSIPGYYSIEVTVVNDQGGTDTEYISLFVNSPPTLIFEVSTVIRTGDTVSLDASDSIDPEGGVVSFEWDFDITVDTNNDGNPSNDVDAHTSISSGLLLAESGNRTGRITVIDDKGATNTSTWTVMVISRTFKITWEQKHVELEWNGYLEQGKSYEIMKNPFPDSRIISMNSTLVLARDILPIMWPEDNFTLSIRVPSSGWNIFSSTTHDNITQNASTTILKNQMNAYPESGYTISADSSEELLYSLLNQAGQRFGQGDWIWTITADECHPDIPIDGIDPDQGNDWKLVIDFLVLVPRISEIGI
jgi:PKD repeat protein